MTRSVSTAQLYVPTLDAAMKRRLSLVSRHNTHAHDPVGELCAALCTNTGHSNETQTQSGQ